MGLIETRIKHFFLFFFFLSLSLSFILWRPKLPISPTSSFLRVVPVAISLCPLLFSHLSDVFLSLHHPNHMSLSFSFFLLLLFFFIIIIIIIVAFIIMVGVASVTTLIHFVRLVGWLPITPFSFYHPTSLNSKLPLLNKSNG